MIQFEKDYAPALAGLVIGALAGLALAIRLRPAAAASARLSGWDARATVPLLMAAALAHLALLPAVELQRIVLFALYATALAATVGLGVAGYAIWRLGAVALPAASILAYAYFAVTNHEADAIGLIVKVVELAAIAAALAPVLRPGPARGRFTVG